jgi:hypothetical protein
LVSSFPLAGNITIVNFHFWFVCLEVKATLIAKSLFQRTFPSRIESFQPIRIPPDAPIEGTKANLENLLGAIFFRNEQSMLSLLVSYKQNTEQPLSSIFALTTFFLSSLFNPLIF